MHHERDAGVVRASKPAATAKRVVLSRAGRRSALTPNSVAGSKAWARAASLMTSAALSIVSKLPLAIVPLDQTGDVLVEDGVAQLAGDRLDALLAPQEPTEVGRVEHVLGPGQTEGGAGDDHGPSLAETARGPACTVRSRKSANEPPELLVVRRRDDRLASAAVRASTAGSVGAAVSTRAAGCRLDGRSRRRRAGRASAGLLAGAPRPAA